jgi:protein-S-isoprenylcysteine O-methyltransferase Ste14
VPVLFVALAFVFFAGVHTGLATRRAKQAARRHFGEAVDRWYRLAYNLIAIITVAPFVYLVFALPDRQLWRIPVPWRYLTTALQLAAAVGLAAALLRGNPKGFVGIRQVVGGGESGDGGGLVTSGVYGCVRHPLYFFSTVILWLLPVMTVNRLAAVVLITLYFNLGSIHEERLLREEFGSAYDEYRMRVPRMIPWKLCAEARRDSDAT